MTTFMYVISIIVILFFASFGVGVFIRKSMRLENELISKEQQLSQSDFNLNLNLNKIANIKNSHQKELQITRETYTNDYYKTALDSLANLTENTDVPPAIRLDASIQLMLSISPVTPIHNSHLRHTNG